MPNTGGERPHGVRTYVALAGTWQEARARVRAEEPGAEFITVPSAIADTLATNVWSISGAELAALRVACDWNESQLRSG
jgi:hypothetical protein